MRIKNWHNFNEGVFNYFNREQKEKRQANKKNKYILNIENSISNFDIYLKLLDRHKYDKDAFDYVEKFIESFSELAKSLDNYYYKFVENNNDNFEEYTNLCYKVLNTAKQVKKFKANLSGWSFGYNPQEILNNAKLSLNKHEERIENIIR